MKKEKKKKKERYSCFVFDKNSLLGGGGGSDRFLRCRAKKSLDGIEKRGKEKNGKRGAV
jgi:hypothetical protein